jgi:FKBP-type peptidyl-prolyl cis-trans isomerase FklB
VQNKSGKEYEMKKYMVVVAMVAILVVPLLAGAQDAPLKTQKDKVSYLIGAQIGNDFKAQQMDIDPDLFSRGLKDALAGKKAPLSEQEIRETMMAFQKEMQTKTAEQNKKLAEQNKKEGDAFLVENKKKEGVKTTPSGLQYKVVRQGTGKMPKPTSTVVVNYRGTLLDGREFDSSYKRGEPFTTAVNGVVKGWQEALPLMKEGAKYQIFVPSQLAYGERGAGREIGPNAVLIFEIELLSIK